MTQYLLDYANDIKACFDEDYYSDYSKLNQKIRESVLSEYSKLVSDPTLISNMGQYLDNAQPFNDLYGSDDSATSIVHLLIDSGLGGSKAYYEQLSKELTTFVSWIKQYTLIHTNTSTIDVVDQFLHIAVSPTNPGAAEIAASLGHGEWFVAGAFAAKEVFQAQDPAAESIKQAVLVGTGVLLTAGVAAGLSRMGVNTVLASVLGVFFASQVTDNLSKNWDSYVSDLRSALIETGDTVLASEKVAAQWTDQLFSWLNKTGSEASSLFDEGLNWAGNTISDISNSLATGLVALPLWVQSLVAEYSVAFNLESPLVLDLAGKGLNLTALNSTVANGGAVAPVYFDMENSGFGIATGWIGSGLLAMDVNGDGNGCSDNMKIEFLSVPQTFLLQVV